MPRKKIYDSRMLTSLKKLLGFEPSAEDLFADAVQVVLAAEGATSYIYDRAKFAFVSDGKTIYLQGIFGRCQNQSPKVQAQLLQRFVRGMLVPPREIKGVRDLADDVVPLMRPRAEIALQPLLADAAGAERPADMAIPAAPFSGALMVTLGIDQTDSIQRVSPADLERVGLSVEDLLPRAKANLRRMYPRLGFAPFSASGVFHSAEAENYQASMLLFPPGQVLQFPAVDGIPLLMAPTRDMMFFTGSENTRGLEALLELVFDSYLDWHNRCPTVFWTWRDDQWVEWQPPLGTAVGKTWANCQTLCLATEYVMQRGALKALYQRTGQDVHVAKYKMVRKNEILHATCTWTEGVTDGLLPMSDTITFVPRSGPPFIVPWPAVEHIAGALLEPVPDLYPRRVRVRRFPTPEQCAAFEVIQTA